MRDVKGGLFFSPSFHFSFSFVFFIYHVRGVGAFLFSCFLSFHCNCFLSFFFVEKSTWGGGGGLFYLFCFCFVFLCRIFFPLQFVCFHFFLSFYSWGVLFFPFLSFLFFSVASFSFF